MSRDLREFFVPEAVEAVEREIDERVQAALEDARPQLEPSPWLSIADAADYLSVSRRTIEHQLTKGLRSSYLDGRRLLHRADIDAWLQGGDGGGKCEPTHPAAASGS